MNSSSEIFGDNKPRAGDVSICIGCGHATIFTEDLTRREPTPEEALIISLNPKTIQVQLTRAHCIGDSLRPKRKVKVK
jgi:hypothetical protein